MVVHLPQKEVRVMSKEELEKYVMSCIENNFNCLYSMKKNCFENYRAWTDVERKFCLDEIKNCSHAVYNNLYELFEEEILSVEKEKEIEKQVQDELLEVANFIIECNREELYERIKLAKEVT